MAAIDAIRAAGFQLRLIDNQIGITPVESLSDYQRSWITQHRNDLLSELWQEAANEAANVDIDRSTDRWQLFIGLAVKYRVTSAEVAAEFNEQDISNLLEEPDEKLPSHAKTIADVIHRNRLAAQIERLKAQAATDTGNQNRRSHVFRSTPLQTCGSCQYFDKEANHPYLGHCRIKAQPEASFGLWSEDGRDYCDEHNAVQP